MKSFFKFAGIAAVALSASLGAQSASADTELRIGTASLGGAYYPMGQALSVNVNNFADGYTMVPIVTGGGGENPRLVASGEVDVALAPASLSFLAVGGKGPYKEALNIQALGALHSSVLHMVTLPGNGIDSIADLKGRTVAVGPAGGGTLGLMRNLFKLYGMTMVIPAERNAAYKETFSDVCSEPVWKSINGRFVSFRFVSFRFVSFRFVSFRSLPPM